MVRFISFIYLFFGIVFFAYTQQQEIPSHKQRLDFAKMYFEVGGNLIPSFTGYGMINNEIEAINNPASFNPYLNWGAFHFWGHAEFYVSIPLYQLNFSSSTNSDYELTQAVVTGFRYLPWAYKNQQLTPYIGVGWQGTEFKQIFGIETDQPTLSKDFGIMPEIGILYGYKGFTARLGASYSQNTQWNYPISTTQFQEIETPGFALQLGILYAWENSHSKDKEANRRWNAYPQVSKLNTGATTEGDFFIAAGPSTSFSTESSSYNNSQLPYLQDQLTSAPYFDLAVGYQSNKADYFIALSFRNPQFQASGYGTTQTIQKTSIAFEVCKFITDYTGFAPYIGLNMAYDHIQYKENTNAHDIDAQSFEPGLTIGWDIVPGKVEEALILRTNLRWYPFSSFEVEGSVFDFAQLEYNLIQAVFYPGRLIRSRRF